MAKIVSSLFMALDGVVEPDKGSWHFPYFNDELGAAVDDTHDTDAFLFGRATYDSFAGAWPDREEAGGEDAAFAKRLGDVRKIVVSRSPLMFTWRNSEQLEGELVEAVTALKAAVTRRPSGSSARTDVSRQRAGCTCRGRAKTSANAATARAALVPIARVAACPKASATTSGVRRPGGRTSEPNSTEPTTAMPAADPTRCIVPITPDAAPASLRSTVATMNWALGAMNRPLPRPPTRSGAARCQWLRSPVGTSHRTSHTDTRLTATIPVPITSTRRPSRCVRRSLCDAPTIEPIANGTDTRPEASAEWPRPACQKIEIVKKMLVKAAK